MDRKPSTTWILTFVFAAALKVVGILTAMTTAYVTSGTWALNRWWGALATAIMLLILLLPWHRLSKYPQAIHIQFITALIFAICAHQLDLIQSSNVPYSDLALNVRFQELLGWSQMEANNVHALGSLFTIVPVVLASWHYGFWGTVSSLGLAGLLYVGAPFWLPDGSFNWWFYAVRGFVLLGVTMILAFVVGILADAQRRKQAELEAAHIKLAEQAAMMEQLATSRERNRLARELHDTLAHSLSGTAVQLQAVGTLMKVDVGAASAELRTAQAQIKSGLAEARRAIAALRANPLAEHGLAQAICQHAHTIAQRSAIHITCDIDTLPTLTPLIEQTFYRIAAEALVNAEKHSQANTVRVELGLETGGKGQEKMVLIVADDGVGFVPDEATHDRQFGLVGMRERAEMISAELNIHSQPQSGTQITLSIPTEY
ncbi:MAG TPA: sensor histidine kinase [Anaerolineae bacterium]|nr:sensor histidine kinase [Anaerolineae bacterium]